MFDRLACFIREQEMSKHRETAAERIWKEKLDECGSFRETAAIFAVLVAVAAVMLAAGF